MAASTQTQTMVEVEPKENSDSRGDAAGGGTLSKTASWIQPTSSGAVAGSLGGGHKQQQQQQRLSSWMPGKLSECGQWLEEKLEVTSNNGDTRISSVSETAAPIGVPIPDYLAREVLKLTVRSAVELEAVWAQVGSQDSDEAKMRVVNQMLSAVRNACEGCVKQERETRDSIVAHINTAKRDILVLSRKLGMPTPAGDEPMDDFFYGEDKLDTLVDRLATLEMKLESLGDQQAERGKVVQNLLDEMATINENMDRQPEEGEDETSGGSEWEGKEGWDLSDERVEKLKGRLANLERLKEERATEMVGLVVACQKLFVQLGLQCTNPLQTKMMMSLDPSSPEDAPSLRTEEQTQTSVGLSAFNVDRLKKMKEDMQEDIELHTKGKEEHRQQIATLWDKLQVPEEERKAHLACTKGITHSDMDNLEAELSRLRKLKGEKLKDMIAEARDKIYRLLQAVGAKAEEVFKASARDLYVSKEDWTEDLLESHEDFVALLTNMEERAKTIIKKVNARERLVVVREEFGSFKVDYRARGGTGVQSQARAIDQMKKELKKLPYITEELRRLLKEWNEREGFPFRYNGREYLKMIEDTDSQWQHRTETNRRVRIHGGFDASPVTSAHLARRTGMHGSTSSGGGDSIESFGGAPSSPTRAATAIQSSVFNTTGGGGPGVGGGHQRPQSMRQISTASLSSSSGSTVFGSPPQPTTTASGGGSLTPNNGSAGRQGGRAASGDNGNGTLGSRTGSGGSTSSTFSGGGGPMVDSRGGATGVTHGEGGSAGARSAGGGDGGAGGAAGGEGGREPAAPVTPQRERPSRNPLLSPFSPPRSVRAGAKPRALANVFASTGGTHVRSPPPPLPARPQSLEKSSQGLGRMQSSPDLVRAATTGSGSSHPHAIGNHDALHEGAGDGDGGGGSARSSGGGGVPPPLPVRPSIAFERADLDAIRESNASSLRSSASASDVLSAGRRTETTR